MRRACAGEAELAGEVERMLAFDSANDSFLATPVLAAPAVAVALGGGESRVPTHIGRYRVLRRIGEGGMGMVYAAEQDLPRRLVALKVIHPALATRAARRRFELESEVLARLSHPCVAHIHDAGIERDDAGNEVPFIAMELIDGEPLSRYLLRSRLTVSERIGLFLLVCGAVEHAHTKGVIHRDLKPANILVDTSGRPKVLDFGIARLLGTGDPAITMHTATGALIGTLAYMSPEQAAGGARELDTRSDVYALGVVLFELLCGRLPIDVAGSSLEQSLRALREQPPQRLGAIDRRLRGDVEVVVDTALQKDPARRYGSVAALAEDLRRVLSNEPILARAPSRIYRVTTFARRHSLMLALVGLASVGLVAGTLVAVWQAWLAHRQRIVAEAARAEALALNDYLLVELLGSPDPRADGRDVRVVDVLLRASGGAAERFAGQPTVEAGVRDTIGQSLVALGLFDVARDELRRALELREQVLGDVHPDTLASRAHYLYVLCDGSDHAAALDVARQLLAARRRVLGDDHPDTLETHNDLGVILSRDRRYQESLPHTLAAVAGRTRVLGGEHPRTLTSRGNLAQLWEMLERDDDAERETREVLDIQSRTLGPDHPDTLISRQNLARFLEQRGRLPDAEAEYRRLVDSHARAFGADHLDASPPLLDLAANLTAQGRYGEARPMIERVIDMRRRGLGGLHFSVVEARRELVRFFTLAGDLVAAETEAAALVDDLRLAERHPDLGAALQSLGRVRRARGDGTGAAAAYAEAVRALRERLSPPHRDIAGALFNLGVVARENGDLPAAATALQDALDMDVALLGPQHESVADDQVELARVWVAQGERAAAESLLAQALATYTATLGVDARRTQAAGTLLDDWRAAPSQP